MAIKFGTNNVTGVKYNSDTENVRQIIKDGQVVYCKKFKAANALPPTGINTVTVYVQSRAEPSVAKPSATTLTKGLNGNSMDLYYGDMVYFSATTTSAQYTANVPYYDANHTAKVVGTSSINGAIDVCTIFNITATDNYQSVAKVTAGTYANVLITTSRTAPYSSNSGWTSGTYTKSGLGSGQTVYIYLKLTQAVDTGYVSSDWALKRGTRGASGSIYLVRTYTFTSNNYTLDCGTIHARTLKKPTIFYDDNWACVRITNSNGVAANCSFYYEVETTSGGWFEDRSGVYRLTASGTQNATSSIAYYDDEANDYRPMSWDDGAQYIHVFDCYMYESGFNNSPYAAEFDEP